MHTDLSKNEDATWGSYWPVGVKLVMFTPHFVLKIIVMYNIQKMFEKIFLVYSYVLQLDRKFKYFRS